MNFYFLSIVTAFILVTLTASEANASFRAGVAKVNGTLPIGVPLAGYNHGARRVPKWPEPVKTEFTTFMTPSKGSMDPTWVKALVIDNGSEKFCFLTVDAIGSDGTLRKMAWNAAVAKGFSVPFEHFTIHGSHTHSGPGAITPSLLWALAPATDLLVPYLQNLIAQHMAAAMLEAEKNMQDATFGIGFDLLYNVTRNRRANISPYVTPDSIDPNLGIMRVDDLSGNPLATVWNFAMHGTCYGPDNMLATSEIMGAVNSAVEGLVGGVSMFINADAGDIDPNGATCNNKPNYDGAPVIAKKIQQVRANITTTSTVDLAGAYTEIPFGPTDMNLTLSRFDNCTSGGPLDICTLCEAIGCEYNAHLGPKFLEETPGFSAIRFTINGVNTLFVTLPGEPLFELGNEVRNDSMSLGFQNTFLAGYSNNHMGYFATPDEYLVGGYESQLTFWGIDTSEQIRAGCMKVAVQVKP